MFFQPVWNFEDGWHSCQRTGTSLEGERRGIVDSTLIQPLSGSIAAVTRHRDQTCANKTVRAQDNNTFPAFGRIVSRRTTECQFNHAGWLGLCTYIAPAICGPTGSTSQNRPPLSRHRINQPRIRPRILAGPKCRAPCQRVKSLPFGKTHAVCPIDP